MPYDAPSRASIRTADDRRSCGAAAVWRDVPAAGAPDSLSPLRPNSNPLVIFFTSSVASRPASRSGLGLVARFPHPTRKEMTPTRHRRLTSILDRRQTDLTVLVDDLQKPHNVSAIVRSCDAVGVGTLHAVSDEATFRTRAATAVGTERYVEIEVHATPAAAAEHLRGTQLVAAHLDDRAVDFRAVDYTRPTCIILGQEGPGVRPELLELADATIAVPMVGAVASLNVSVAAAVILYEAQRQREAAGLYDTPHVDDATRQRLLFEWGYRRIARWCRDRGRPYPEVADDGSIVGPFP